MGFNIDGSVRNTIQASLLSRAQHVRTKWARHPVPPALCHGTWVLWSEPVPDCADPPRVWWAAACTVPGWPGAQASPAVPASAPRLPQAGLSLKQDTVLGSASAFSFCSFRRRLWWWRPWSAPPVICNHRPMWWWIGPWWQMILITDTKSPRAAASNVKPKWDLLTVIIIYVTVMVTICSWSSYVPPPTHAQSTF